MVLLGGLCDGATSLERETLAGTFVRTVVVGPAQLRFAVDERSGRAVVLSRSTDSPDVASVSIIETASGCVLHTIPLEQGVRPKIVHGG